MQFDLLSRGSFSFQLRFTMLRSPTSQLLFRSLTKAQNARLSYNAASSKLRVATPLQQFTARRPIPIRSIARPTVTSLLYATKPQDAVERTDEGGGDMLAGVKSDWATIKETFSMADVPKESLYLGLAGLLPYAATSASTIALSYDINHAHIYGSGIMFTPELAHQLLDIITPVQIGFGAVVSLYPRHTKCRMNFVNLETRSFPSLEQFTGV